MRRKITLTIKVVLMANNQMFNCISCAIERGYINHYQHKTSNFSNFLGGKNILVSGQTGILRTAVFTVSQLFF